MRGVEGRTVLLRPLTVPLKRFKHRIGNGSKIHSFDLSRLLFVTCLGVIRWRINKSSLEPGLSPANQLAAFRDTKLSSFWFFYRHI